jgi:hypothetical protein
MNDELRSSCLSLIIHHSAFIIPPYDHPGLASLLSGDSRGDRRLRHIVSPLWRKCEMVRRLFGTNFIPSSSSSSPLHPFVISSAVPSVQLRPRAAPFVLKQTDHAPHTCLSPRTRVGRVVIDTCFAHDACAHTHLRRDQCVNANIFRRCEESNDCVAGSAAAAGERAVRDAAQKLRD